MWHPIETFPLDGKQYLVRRTSSIGYTEYDAIRYDRDTMCFRSRYKTHELWNSDEWTHIPE